MHFCYQIDRFLISSSVGVPQPRHRQQGIQEVSSEFPVDFPRAGAAVCGLHLIQQVVGSFIEKKIDQQHIFGILKYGRKDFSGWQVSYGFDRRSVSTYSPLHPRPFAFWSLVMDPYLITGHNSVQRRLSFFFKPIQKPSTNLFTLSKEKWATPRGHYETQPFQRKNSVDAPNSYVYCWCNFFCS